MTKPVGRLGVAQDGSLVETNELDVAKFDKLFKVAGTPSEGRIVLQPLPTKEKTVSGIILPGTSELEFRAAVVAVNPKSPYKRGDVVMLKTSDFYPAKNLPVDYCEGNPLLVMYESFIWYTYGYRIEDEA